jgi:hypothetical protein
LLGWRQYRRNALPRPQGTETYKQNQQQPIRTLTQHQLPLHSLSRKLQSSRSAERSCNSVHKTWRILLRHLPLEHAHKRIRALNKPQQRHQHSPTPLSPLPRAPKIPKLYSQHSVRLRAGPPHNPQPSNRKIHSHFLTIILKTTSKLQ